MSAKQTAISLLGYPNGPTKMGRGSWPVCLSQAGYTSTYIDIRGIQGLLHLKSGIAYLGERRLVLIDELAEMEAFHGYEIVPVEAAETYAANCVRVNDYVLIAAGFPGIEKTIRSFGYPGDRFGRV